jgi:hypothetical protein
MSISTIYSIITTVACHPFNMFGITFKIIYPIYLLMFLSFVKWVTGFRTVSINNAGSNEGKNMEKFMKQRGQ